jgi:hypothetical protein
MPEEFNALKPVIIHDLFLTACSLLRFIPLCYDSCGSSNMRFERNPTSMCREMNSKLFLVPPLRQGHVLYDDHVFLIIVIVNVTKYANNNESTLLSE